MGGKRTPTSNYCRCGLDIPPVASGLAARNNTSLNFRRLPICAGHPIARCAAGPILLMSSGIGTGISASRQYQLSTRALSHRLSFLLHLRTQIEAAFT
jgi:hypothetical protein